MKIKVNVVSVCILLIYLPACTTLPQTQLGVVASIKPHKNCMEEAPELVAALENGNVRQGVRLLLKDDTDELPVDKVDIFLTCLFGKLTATDPEILKAQKLYRGYMVLALISRYASFNYTGSVSGLTNLDFRTYSRLSQDALATQSRIVAAANLLRPSEGADVDTEAELFARSNVVRVVPDVARTHRVLSVVFAAHSAGQPTIERTKSYFSELIRAIAGSGLNAGNVLEDGLTIIGKGLVLRVYGETYVHDLKDRITLINMRGIKSDDWSGWTELIKDSCMNLGNVSGNTELCKQL